MIYIHHHLGLGDHIICNGMVRHFVKRYGDARLFCYERNKKNIEYMYRDLTNLKFIFVNSDNEVTNFIKNNNLENSTVRVGFETLIKYIGDGFNESFNYPTPRLTFDEAFYDMVNIDFAVRFNEFYIERDLELENKVLEKLNPSNEKFIFIHDDPKRGYNIDLNKIQSPYKEIYNDMDFKIFDYLSLFEKAEEVHVMQSSFKDLINSYEFATTKFFLHCYARGTKWSDDFHSKGLNKFIKIE